LSFVLYDVETTGLNKRYDQILQFAAVRADADLVETDRFETQARLLSHVVPSPTALHVNGVHISDLFDPSRPSHYAMVCQIAERLRQWTPSVFLGFNSLSFDEEFLRQAFYACLHPPFLTNTSGNTRADILNLARAAAVFEPGAINIPQQERRAVFRLEELARANGFVGGPAHDARTDVQASLHLCRLLHDACPDIWSRFLRFAQSRAAEEFVTEEEAFILFDQVGSIHSTHTVTKLGAHPSQANLIYCLDLARDIDALRALGDEDLGLALAASARPVRRLRLNRAPLLFPLYDAPASVLIAEEGALMDRAKSVREDPSFISRLVSAAATLEREYPPSAFVEEQIYSGGFPSDDEAGRMRRFHLGSAEERARLVSQFEDARNRRLAMRIIYFEHPDHLPPVQRQHIEEEIFRRRQGVADPQPACQTAPLAIAEAEDLLLKSGLDDANRTRLLALLAYLRQTAAH
jgi:exodeoxyribonuclease-1